MLLFYKITFAHSLRDPETMALSHILLRLHRLFAHSSPPTLRLVGGRVVILCDQIGYVHDSILIQRKERKRNEPNPANLITSINR